MDIAANLGHDESIQMLKKCYKIGHVSKENFASALRSHHAAVEATKSPQREEASNHACTKVAANRTILSTYVVSLT